jgi:glutamate-1-semialdehyde 2,1-aminomutase
LVVDEISAGFRMNTGGAHLVVGLKPDIAVFSKAMGNGYAVGAVIGKRNVMQAAQNTFISSTNWTERVGAAAALATIRKHGELNVAEHLTNIGRKVQETWSECASNHGVAISVGGIYPLGHFAFGGDKNRQLLLKALFVQEMVDQGILGSTSFYAMAAHKDAHVDEYAAAADRAFAAVAEGIATDNIESKLRGRPAAAGFQRLA